jgi:hypothetical protein
MPMHLEFIDYYIKHSNGTQAYLNSNPNVTYKSAKELASRLLKQPLIIERVEQEQERLALIYDISKESIIRELTDTAEEAKNLGRYGEYSKMKDMIIKMFGFYESTKVDVTSGGDKFNIIFDLNIDKKKNDDDDWKNNPIK